MSKPELITESERQAVLEGYVTRMWTEHRAENEEYVEIRIDGWRYFDNEGPPVLKRGHHIKVVIDENPPGSEKH